jgi:PIN domain nuclease of toxin-antitoxin system
MRVLLDTCSLLWAVAFPERLTPRTQQVLRLADTEVLVSVISCAEIARIQARRRIALDRHWKFWFRHYVAVNNWPCLAINLDVMEEAYSLPEPFHSDPADRILVATARLNNCTLLTADRKLLDYPHVKTMW